MKKVYLCPSCGLYEIYINEVGDEKVKTICPCCEEEVEITKELEETC